MRSDSTAHVLIPIPTPTHNVRTIDPVRWSEQTYIMPEIDSIKFPCASTTSTLFDPAGNHSRSQCVGWPLRFLTIPLSQMTTYG